MWSNLDVCLESQRHVNNKQWLRKDQDRSVIAKQIKSVGNVLYAMCHNADESNKYLGLSGKYV